MKKQWRMTVLVYLDSASALEAEINALDALSRAEGYVTSYRIGQVCPILHRVKP